MAFERTQAFEEIFHARKITVVKVEGNYHLLKEWERVITIDSNSKKL